MTFALHLIQFSKKISYEAALIPKKWLYKSIFNSKLLQLYETGSLNSIRLHWETELPDCSKVVDEEASLALGRGLNLHY